MGIVILLSNMKQIKFLMIENTLVCKVNGMRINVVDLKTQLLEITVEL